MSSLTKSFNPYFKKVSYNETSTGKSATFGGIAFKIFFFLIMTGAGVAAYILNLVPQEFMMYSLIGAGGVAIISALLSYLVPSITPVTGTLFCVSQGFLAAFVCTSYASLYNGIIPIALGVTVTVILVMLLLYSTGIIKVGQKFKAVISTLFLASIIIGGLVFISSFFTDAISSVVYGNGWIGIGISLISVIIASLHLAIDFDNILQGVKQKANKKYEWCFAFGIITTVIMLFVRVLELLSKIMPKDNN